MKKLSSCAYHMDTGCVELRYRDGTCIAIDCTAVEDVLNPTLTQRSELDWLIYNRPAEYADLIFSGNIAAYLSGPPMHGLED